MKQKIKITKKILDDRLYLVGEWITNARWAIRKKCTINPSIFESEESVKSVYGKGKPVIIQIKPANMIRDLFRLTPKKLRKWQKTGRLLQSGQNTVVSEFKAKNGDIAYFQTKYIDALGVEVLYGAFSYDKFVNSTNRRKIDLFLMPVVPGYDSAKNWEEVKK